MRIKDQKKNLDIDKPIFCVYNGKDNEMLFYLILLEGLKLSNVSFIAKDYGPKLSYPIRGIETVLSI